MESKKTPSSAKSNKSKTPAAKTPGTSNGKSERYATAVLSAQHEAIKKGLLEIAKFDGSDASLAALRRVAHLWQNHTSLETGLFIPELRKAGVDETALIEAQLEHDLVNMVLGDLLSRDASDAPHFAARVRVFVRILMRLMDLEQQPGQGLFDKAKDAGVDLAAIGKRLQSEIHESSNAEASPDAAAPRDLRQAGAAAQTKETDDMANTPERDEQGRFVSDDDRRYGRSSRESYGRSGRMQNDDDRGMSRGGNHRSSSHTDDDDYDRSRASHRQDDDDYHGRSGSRSMGSSSSMDDRRHSRSGWYGDNERHSEASQRGWRNPDHGESGWYGDSERHSEASRRGWRNPDHGDSGWYGDSRGHGEASRRGWENPDHERSGWFGDREGHSQAARRGWDDRRSSSPSSRRDDDDDYDMRYSRRR